MTGFEDYQMSAWVADGLTLRVIKPLSEAAKSVRSMAVAQAGAWAIAAGMAFLPPAATANVVIPAHHVTRPAAEQTLSEAEIDPSNWKLIINRLHALSPVLESDVDLPPPIV